jgi:hypothetical protein
MRPGRLSASIVASLGLVLLVCTLAVGQSQPSRNDSANSLPPTNFSADGSVDRSGLPRPAPGFANASVARNPLAPDARAVGEKTCIACHRLEADHFTHTLHALGLHVANRSDPTITAAPTGNSRISLRLYDNYEHGQISDWHYAGFNNTLVYGNRVYTDAGPQGYNTNLIGLLVNVKL